MTSFITIVFLFLGFQPRASTPIIEITSVNITIATRITVPCSEFEQRFDGRKKVRILKGRKEVNSFLNELNNLPKFNGKKKLIPTRELRY